MKIRYPAIALILISIAIIIIDGMYWEWDLWAIADTIIGVLGILFIACLILIIYLIIRNIFNAITQQKKSTPDYKRPPWEG